MPSGVKKESRKLRIKEFGLYSQGCVKARRERCWSPWCTEFVEDMGKTNRCNTQECTERLWDEARARGLMVRVADAWVGTVEPLLRDPNAIEPGIHTRMIIGEEQSLCKCGRGYPRPNSDLCIDCHRVAMRSDFYNRRNRR